MLFMLLEVKDFGADVAFDKRALCAAAELIANNGYSDEDPIVAIVTLPAPSLLEQYLADGETEATSVSEYADTEVSTNIAFNADDAHMREFEMRFALDGGMSNCVQVAFGKDADGDGVLGADEAETLYGWRNGRYFAESVTEGLRVEEADSGNVDSRVFAINLRLKKGEGLRYFTATNDMGVAIFTNLNATAQNWLYKPDWNMMRVTRRGPGVPAEWFSCDLSSHFFYIKLR